MSLTNKKMKELSLFSIVWRPVLAVLLTFHLRCLTLCHLNGLCSFPIWCLGHDVEFDVSVPDHFLFIYFRHVLIYDDGAFLSHSGTCVNAKTIWWILAFYTYIDPCRGYLHFIWVINAQFSVNRHAQDFFLFTSELALTLVFDRPLKVSKDAYYILRTYDLNLAVVSEKSTILEFSHIKT